MSARPNRNSVALLLMALAATAALAQSEQPAPPPLADPTHDISKVDPVSPGNAIAVPLPESQQRRLKKYEIPELVGARQALGSQLIDGRLPKPLVDYWVHDSKVDQRISLFEGGLVVVKMAGAGGVIRKRVLIPDDALAVYRRSASPDALRAVRTGELTPPNENRRSLFRVYDEAGFVERVFDPAGVVPKKLQDQLGPLEDLLRAVSEDRTVTSTVANYEPKVGDQLVGDDRKTYRVERIVAESGVVVLRCTSQPTTIYVSKKDLYNYFIGARAE